jgi:hypothetical protein
MWGIVPAALRRATASYQRAAAHRAVYRVLCGDDEKRYTPRMAAAGIRSVKSAATL